MLTVVHSDTVFENRPSNSPTVEELIVYLLQEEIRNTAKLGEFSGLLQVQFFAGSIQHPIQQHCQEQAGHGEYKHMLHPCACCEVQQRQALHIMWVSMDPLSTSINHIIPLLPKSTCIKVRSKHQALPLYDYKECLLSHWGQCSTVICF